MGSPVIHFEIHADDPDRCRRFYERVFGWATNDVPGMEQQYWLMYPNGAAPSEPGGDTGPGIAGGMMVRRGPRPAADAPVNGFACILQVDDLDAAYAAVQEHGGDIAVEPMAIPGVGRVFYAHDTEGNIVGALQP